MKPNSKLVVSVIGIKRIIFCTLFIMLISMPFVYKEIKILLILLLLLFALFNLKAYLTVSVDKNLMTVFIFFILTNGLFVLLGMFNKNVGAWATLPINLIWPILYFIIILDARFYIGYKEIELIMKLSLIIIAFYTFLYYSKILFGIQIQISEKFIYHNFDPSDPKATANQIAMPAATSLFFLVPFFMSIVLLSKENKISNYIYLFLGAVVSLATGRRALILLILSTPIIVLILSVFLPFGKISTINRVLKKIVITLLLLLFVIIILERNKIIDITFLRDKTVSYFIPSTSGLEKGAVVRNYQKNALIEKWKESPLLGFGFGGTAGNYIRNPKTPFAYELSYVAKLMNIGIVGMSIYLFFIVYIISKLTIYLKNNYVFYLAAITGFIIILIANSSNPYLDSFEYMWMIYFQILFIFIGEKYDKIQIKQESFNDRSNYG